jgi:hypothetical protein
MIGSPDPLWPSVPASNVELWPAALFLFLFVSAIPFRALNLRDCVAIWDNHLLSFVPFTLAQHLTEV